MKMMQIKKTSTVKPAEKTSRRSIPVTLLDRTHIFPTYNSIVNIYRPTNIDNAVNGVALRESLSKTLVHFYPMAGRIRLDGDGLMEIDCNDEGVPFVEAETESELEALGALSPSTEMSVLLPPIDLTTRDVSYYPMMAVQVTHFKCGGVVISVRVEHHSVDGASTFHLIRSWSEITRGLDISTLPFLDRHLLLCPRDPPRPKFEHHEYSQYGPTNQISSSAAKSNEVRISVFGLTGDQLHRMKSDCGHNYSTFEVLAGHIWKCVCKARGIGGGEETRLMFPVDGRFGNRLKPPLPRGFFGNAFFRGVSLARAGDLESEPLGYAAAKIHETLVRMDDAYSRSAIDHLALLPDDLKAAKVGPHLFYAPNVQITSWAKIGLNDADFGWGPPVYTGPGSIRYEKAYVFPTEHHNGGLSVAIALRPQHMDAFETLFHDLRLHKKQTFPPKL